MCEGRFTPRMISVHTYALSAYYAVLWSAALNAFDLVSKLDSDRLSMFLMFISKKKKKSSESDSNNVVLIVLA